MCDFPFVVIMLNLNVFWFLHFLLYDFHLEEIIPRSFHAAVGTDSPQGYHSLCILAFTNRKIFSMSHYGQNVSQVITLSPFKWDRPMKENFIMVLSNAHHFDVYFKGNSYCNTFLGTLSNILFWNRKICVGLCLIQCFCYLQYSNVLCKKFIVMEIFILTIRYRKINWR